MIARYVRDFLFEASSEELYNKFYKDIPQDIYTQIVKADPTSMDRKNGKYCKWLFNIYMNIENKRVFIEDLYKITDALILFKKYSNKLDKNQIQQYKDYKELISATESFENEEEEVDEDIIFDIKTASKKDINDIKTNETDKVYEDNEWLIVIPTTARSSCFWGLGTKWCTAAKNIWDNAFEDYTRQAPIYIIINKNLKDDKNRQLKFQFFFSLPNDKSYDIRHSMQLMNSKDNYIDKDEIDLFKNDIKEFLVTKILNFEDVYKWDKMFGYTNNMFEHLTKINPDINVFLYFYDKYEGLKSIIQKYLTNIDNIETIILNHELRIQKLLDYIEKYPFLKDTIYQYIIKSKDSPYYVYNLRMWLYYYGDKNSEIIHILLQNKEYATIITYFGDTEFKDTIPSSDINKVRNIILDKKLLSAALDWSKVFPSDSDIMFNMVINNYDNSKDTDVNIIAVMGMSNEKYKQKVLDIIISSNIKIDYKIRICDKWLRFYKNDIDNVFTKLVKYKPFWDFTQTKWTSNERHVIYRIMKKYPNVSDIIINYYINNYNAINGELYLLCTNGIILYDDNTPWIINYNENTMNNVVNTMANNISKGDNDKKSIILLAKDFEPLQDIIKHKVIQLNDNELTNNWIKFFKNI